MQQKPSIHKDELLSLPDVYFLLNNELNYDSDEVIGYIEEKGLEWLKQQRILLHYLQSDPDYKDALSEFAHEEIKKFLLENKEILSLNNEFKEFFHRSGHDRSVTISDVYASFLNSNPTFVVDLIKSNKDHSQVVRAALSGENQRLLFGLFERFAESTQDPEVKRGAFKNLLMVEQFPTPFCQVLRSTTGEYSKENIAALSIAEVSYILRYAPNQSFTKASNLLLAVAADENLNELLTTVTDTLLVEDFEPSLEEAVDYFSSLDDEVEPKEILDIFNVFFDDEDSMKRAAIKALIQTESILLSKLNPHSVLPEILSMITKEELISSFSDAEKIGILHLCNTQKKHVTPLVNLFKVALEQKDYLLLSIILNSYGIRLYTGFDDKHKILPKEVTSLSNFKELCQAIIHADSEIFLNPLIRVLETEMSPASYFSTLWAMCVYAEECHSYTVLKMLERVLTPLIEKEFIEKNRQNDFAELIRLSNLESLEHVVRSSRVSLEGSAKKLINNTQYFYSSCIDAALSREPMEDFLDILRCIHAGNLFQNPRIRAVFTGKLHEVICNFHKLLFISDLEDKKATSLGLYDRKTSRFVEYHPSSYAHTTCNPSKVKISIIPDLELSTYQLIFRFMMVAENDTANTLAVKLVESLRTTNFKKGSISTHESSFFWLALSHGSYKLADLLRNKFSKPINESMTQATSKDDVSRIKQLLHICLKSRFSLSPENSKDLNLVSAHLYAGYLTLTREQRLKICGKNYEKLLAEITKIFEEGERSVSVLNLKPQQDFKKLIQQLMPQAQVAQESQDLFEIFMGAISLSPNKKMLFQAYVNSHGSDQELSFSSLSKVVSMTGEKFRNEFLIPARIALCSNANFIACQENIFSRVLGNFIPSEISKRILAMTFGRPLGNLHNFTAEKISSIFKEQMTPRLTTEIEKSSAQQNITL